MTEWVVYGTSMVVEADTAEEAVGRAQETSGWHWEAKEWHKDERSLDPEANVEAEVERLREGRDVRDERIGRLEHEVHDMRRDLAHAGRDYGDLMVGRKPWLPGSVREATLALGLLARRGQQAEAKVARVEADLRARHPKIENPTHGCCAPPKLCHGHGPECGGRTHGLDRPPWPCGELRTLDAALRGPEPTEDAERSLDPYCKTCHHPKTYHTADRGCTMPLSQDGLPLSRNERWHHNCGCKEPAP